MIRTVAIAGYRSLREVVIGLGQLTVVTGGNGTGKSNLYRALRLLVDAAEGTLGRALAKEGGMPSAMWAGHWPKKEPRRICIGFSDDVVAYELQLGLPQKSDQRPLPPFALDPEVKEETIRTIVKPKAVLLERKLMSVFLRDDDGNRQVFPTELDLHESVLSQLAEPHRYPALSQVRERVRRWRFYHQIRTDPDSPLRAEQTGSRTPVMAHDGHDVAAALQTILENGDDEGLLAAVRDGLSGAELAIRYGDQRFLLGLSVEGFERPMLAPELSDGQLRYLALMAALYSPRPPEVLVLNEPETSLHPSLLAPLARQIARAAKRSQVIVVSHAAPLVDALAREAGIVRVELVKDRDATVIA